MKHWLGVGSRGSVLHDSIPAWYWLDSCLYIMSMYIYRTILYYIAAKSYNFRFQVIASKIDVKINIEVIA